MGVIAKAVKITLGGLKKLQQKLNQLQAEQMNAFIESCAKELAARLLAKVVKRTPVGNYSREVKVVAKKNSKNHQKGETYTKRVNTSGKMGGTLQRGWTAQSHEEAQNGSGTPTSEQAKAYADSLSIQHNGNMLIIEIINPVEYASYVEFGHRTKSGGWVDGRFMLTISEQEIQSIAPKVLEKKLKQFLMGCVP